MISDFRRQTAGRSPRSSGPAASGRWSCRPATARPHHLRRGTTSRRLTTTGSRCGGCRQHAEAGEDIRYLRPVQANTGDRLLRAQLLTPRVRRAAQKAAGARIRRCACYSGVQFA